MRTTSLTIRPARFDELRTEIRAAQDSANSQMEELRGYIVQHLNQHR